MYTKLRKLEFLKSEFDLLRFYLARTGMQAHTDYFDAKWMGARDLGSDPVYIIIP
jgi:hypothetical protein